MKRKEIGVLGILFLLFTCILLFFNLPKYINGEVPWPWLVTIITFTLSTAAILVGFDIVKAEQLVSLYKIENKTWKDNLKQGLRAFSIGIPSLIVGIILLLGVFSSEPGELDFGPLTIVAYLMPFGFGVMGAILSFLSAKIWINTRLRYQEGDETFNNQKWSESGLINDIISGKL